MFWFLKQVYDKLNMLHFRFSKLTPNMMSLILLKINFIEIIAIHMLKILTLDVFSISLKMTFMQIYLTHNWNLSQNFKDISKFLKV